MAQGIQLRHVDPFLHPALGEELVEPLAQQDGGQLPQVGLPHTGHHVQQSDLLDRGDERHDPVF